MIICVIILGNWDHYSWELLMKSVYWSLLFCCYGVDSPAPLLIYWSRTIPLFSWMWLTSSDWSFPFSSFYRSGLGYRWCFNLVLLWNIFHSRYVVTDSFADIINSAGICSSQSLTNISPGPSGFQNSHCEIRYYFNGPASIC